MTNDQLMATAVWHVEVYNDNGKTEYYNFLHQKDLITSINTTWSKCLDTIRVTVGGSEIEVHSTDLLNTRLLCANRVPLNYVIEDRPTHF